MDRYPVLPSLPTCPLFCCRKEYWSPTQYATSWMIPGVGVDPWRSLRGIAGRAAAGTAATGEVLTSTGYALAWNMRDRWVLVQLLRNCALGWWGWTEQVLLSVWSC